MIRFEEELYEAVCKAFPATTVRTFSQALGMSEGYWSSIMAQGLKVSNTALIRLSEHLGTRLVLVGADGPRALRVRSIQQMIAKEIVDRFSRETEGVDNIWAEVECVGATLQDDHSGNFGALPFVMIRG